MIKDIIVEWRGGLSLLAARCENGRIVVLPLTENREVEEIRKLKFYCPMCGDKVMMKIGNKVIPHFAHYESSDCPNLEKGESLYHEQGKLDLFRWLCNLGVEAKLEAYIQKIKQRPDILAKWNGQHYAIEYQCATISEEIFRQRTNGYKKLGIIPIWISGHKRINQVGTYCIRQSQFDRNFFGKWTKEQRLASLISYCPQTKCITLYSNPYPFKSKVYVQTNVIHLKGASFTDILQAEPLPYSNLLNLWLPEKIKFRSFRSNFVSKEDKYYLRYLYSKGMHPQFLPSIIHLPVPSQFMFKESVYIWQSKVVLDNIIPLQNDELINENNLDYKYKNTKPLAEYLHLLSLIGVLKRTNKNVYVKAKPLPFHKTVDEAINHDKLIIKQIKDRIK
jgi:competence protein CoiA